MVKRFLFLLFLPLFLWAEVIDISDQKELNLEAFLEAGDPWYPGQTGRFIYKISYKGSIQLLEEKLPLFELEGFEKVGDKQFRDYRELGLSVQEISQKVRSIKPGTFVSPYSLIVGAKYVQNGSKKQFVPPLLRSELPPFSIVVKPMPAENVPPSFNGSLGKFNFSIHPLPSNEFRVGDWIDLTITATGTEFLEDLKAPDFICSPGFLGFFEMKGTPFISEVNRGDTSKTFQFKISPVNNLLDKIPSISWTTFDPKSGKYQEWKSEPIPIRIVEPIANVEEKERLLPSLIPPSYQEPTPLINIPTMKESSLFNSLLVFLFTKGYWILLGLFFIALAIAPLRDRYQKWQQKRMSDPLYAKREELFQTKDEALLLKSWDHLLSSELIKKGYMTENGQWSNANSSLLENIKLFLQEIAKARFQKNRGPVPKEISSKGLKIYSQIQKLPYWGLILLFSISSLYGDALEKGNLAKSFDSRSHEWNLALETLLLETKDKPLYAQNPKTLETIAFLYEQFGERSLAILYLERALWLSPLNRQLSQKLEKIRTDGGIPPPQKMSILSFVSVIQWWTIGFFFALIALYLYAFKKIPVLFYSSSAFAIVIFLILGIKDNLMPVRGIIIEPTFIFTESDLMNHLNLPLISGEDVSIVGIDQDSILIMTRDHKLGFISNNSIRPIRVSKNVHFGL